MKSIRQQFEKMSDNDKRALAHTLGSVLGMATGMGVGMGIGESLHSSSAGVDSMHADLPPIGSDLPPIFDESGQMLDRATISDMNIPTFGNHESSNVIAHYEDGTTSEILTSSADFLGDTQRYTTRYIDDPSIEAMMEVGDQAPNGILDQSLSDWGRSYIDALPPGWDTETVDKDVSFYTLKDEESIFDVNFKNSKRFG